MPFDKNDTELKAYIEEQIEAATAPLVSKRDELLRENKKLKAKGSDIDPSEHEKLQDQVNDLTSKLDRATKDADKLKAQLGSKDAALQKHLIDGGLADALAKANVPAHFMDAAKALLRQQASIKADGDNLSAVIGEKSLVDAVKEWAATDAGKHFVTAPQNSGGGAPGGGGKSGEVNPFAKETFNLTQQVLMKRDNPELATQMEAQAKA